MADLKSCPRCKKADCEANRQWSEKGMASAMSLAFCLTATAERADVAEAVAVEYSAAFCDGYGAAYRRFAQDTGLRLTPEELARGMREAKEYQEALLKRTPNG